MDFINQIVKLTPAFYAAYPDPPYCEIMNNSDRQYNCLLIDTHYDYYICLPYRSHIPHNNAFKFRNSARSRRTDSGIDYSKMIIIRDPSYISSYAAIIDQDEFRETMRYLNIIVSKAIKYLEDYIGHVQGVNTMEIQEYNRKYSRSTLPYFHKELGI